jgi:Na+/proline symporter
MGSLDWVIFGVYLTTILTLGVWTARKSRSAEGFFVADRSVGWLAVGLSVMATQASAITFIGTTGKAYTDGMGFVQFYFGLPVAMVILAFTLMPAFRRAGVFTAYEWLGKRFDGKTRLLSAVLFLISRGLALGIVVYAPSVVLSMLLGWSLPTTVLSMTVVAVAYTMLGGIRAVIFTDVVQMVLILGGLLLCLWRMAEQLPPDLGLIDTLPLAEATGRLQLLDWSFDPQEKYTVWSGLLGGTFLFLAYFGCDQSQVQRLLATRSVNDGRRALFLNAFCKIPLQLFVLFLGVTLFLTFHFVHPPLLFDGEGRQAILDAGRGAQLSLLEDEHAAALVEREAAARALLAAAEPERSAAQSAYLATDTIVRETRDRGAALATSAQYDKVYDDTNFVFPHFVINYLPAGIVGLLIAAFFAAAMSSMDSELNALATTSVVDVWGRYVRPDASGAQSVVASRWFTALWGLLAGLFALKAAELGSAIEAVNTLGSYFYGSLLGVFVLALAVPSANGHGAFCGLLAGMASVAWAAGQDIAWLWLNPLACGVVVVVGYLVSASTGSRRSADGTA